MTITKKRVPKQTAVTDGPRGRGRPQVRPDEETRVIIFNAARHEFASSGYAAANIESVARRAGVSTKTLYRLIPNKAALFEEMVTDRMNRFASVVRLRPCDGEDIEAALREALVACGELILDAEVLGLLRMVLGEGEKFPEISETFYRKAIRRTETTLANWLSAQHKAGLIGIENADAAAGMLLGMLAFQPQRAVLFGHAPPPGREDIKRYAQAAARLFLKGCAR
jgi:AcrR family transcriptional regulator